MPDAQPKPTAADVLREHRDVCGDGSLCDCGWQRPLRPGAATPGPGMYLRHVEDMLAAAGLLATAEPHPVVDPMLRPGQAVTFARWLAQHDAAVQAQALRDAADGINWANQGWLRRRADRIAAGEVP